MYTLGCCAGSLGFQQLNMKASWRPLLLDWDGLEPYTHLQKKPPTITGPIVITLLLNMNGKKNKVVWLTVRKQISRGILGRNPSNPAYTWNSKQLTNFMPFQNNHQFFMAPHPHDRTRHGALPQGVPSSLSGPTISSATSQCGGWCHETISSYISMIPKTQSFLRNPYDSYIYNWLLLISLGCSLAV